MIEAGETQRLLLRPLELADADGIQKEFPHWEIVRYLLKRVPWPYPPDGAYQFCRDVALPQMERGEAWHWTLRLRSQPAQLIGQISLTNEESSQRGFWLALPWHGQGLMSEACHWANDFWFEKLGFPLLRVSKAIENTASQKISEKQGMRAVGCKEQEYVGGRLMSMTWEITAEEWLAWKSRNAVS